MLILPPGHAQTLKVRRATTTREKWILGSVLAVVAALIVVVVISIGTSERQTGNGCVDVKFPITIGGEELYQCGPNARGLCASVGSASGFTSVAGRAVARECRKAGLPVG